MINGFDLQFEDGFSKPHVLDINNTNLWHYIFTHFTPKIKLWKQAQWKVKLQPLGPLLLNIKYDVHDIYIIWLNQTLNKLSFFFSFFLILSLHCPFSLSSFWNVFLFVSYGKTFTICCLWHKLSWIVALKGYIEGAFHPYGWISSN